jgi:predicted enzyme related to lactoylglutathione lyase
MRSFVGIALVFLTGAAFGAAAAGCAAQRARAEAARADERARATGIGGIFFKAKDPKKLQAWYVEHLGFPAPKYGVNFEWRDKTSPDKPGSTTWATFPMSTTYFDPTTAPFMINYRVVHLDAVLAHLREVGTKVDEKIESEDNGRFAWAIDPEGNRFELWEPTPGH